MQNDSRVGEPGEHGVNCRWCADGCPEWSIDAKVWIHRREHLDRRCENPPALLISGLLEAVRILEDAERAACVEGMLKQVGEMLARVTRCNIERLQDAIDQGGKK